MAAQLKLVSKTNDASYLDDLDLLDYNAGFNLARDGWQQRTGTDVSNAITLHVQATSDDNLASVIQALDVKIQSCQWRASGVDTKSIWLRAQLTNESEARDAFLYELDYTPPSFSRAQRTILPRLTMGFRRGPWEDSATTLFASDTGGVSSTAGTFSYTGNTGDLPARISYLRLDTYAGDNLSKYWVGFRTARYGTVANFQSYWPLASAWDYDADTTVGVTNADASAKDGYKTVTTFSADATMIRRAACRVQDVTANPNDQRGRYIVLLRAKLSAGSSEARARLISGYASNPDKYAFGARAAVTATTWNLYELGEINIPAHLPIGGSDIMSTFFLGVAAERISGSANLEMDCLILIPIAEGYFSVKADEEVDQVGIVQHADGTISAWAENSLTPSQSVSVSGYGGLPVADGIVVFAGEGDASDIDDLVDIYIYAYQRWQTLRGSET